MTLAHDIAVAKQLEEPVPSLVGHFFWHGAKCGYEDAFGSYEKRGEFTPAHGQYAGETMCVDPSEIRVASFEEFINSTTS